MTKLTTERLEKLQDDLLQFQDFYSDPADKENYDIFVDALHMLDEFKAAKEKLLAYEQAAKDIAFWGVTGHRGQIYQLPSQSERIDSLPLYRAPVLHKQPDHSRQHFESLCKQFWNWAEFDEINQDEEPRLEWNSSNYTHRVTAALWKMYQAAPAQPVSEPYELPDGWVMVPQEATMDMLKAGAKQAMKWEAFQYVWSAMLAAAPAQESE